MDLNSFIKKFAEHFNKPIEKINIEECTTIHGKLNFFKLGDLLVNAYGFDYIDSELYGVLDKIKNIKSKNNLCIIFAADKDKANSLSETHFGEKGANAKESQYSMLNFNEKVYIFFNYSRLIKSDVCFLIEKLDMKASLIPNQKTQEKILKMYQTIIQTYVESAGYKKTVFNDAEVELFRAFRNILLNSVNEPFALTNLLSTYSTEVLTNINRRIHLFSQKEFNKIITSLHDLQNFLGLTTLFLGWSIDISLASKAGGDVNDSIDKIIIKSDWGEYDDFREPFMNYFTSLSDMILLCKTQEEILDKYVLCVLDLIRNMPKRIVRINETMELDNRIMQLISLFQLTGSDTKELQPEMEQFLEETKNILDLNEDPVSIYFIQSMRNYLLAQFSIITQNKNLFNQAYEESLKHVEFIINNYQKIKSIFPISPVDEDDIVFCLNFTSYLCFCHQEFDKFKEIRLRIKELMKKYNVSIFTRIMINQLEFLLEEDYACLNDTYRLYRTYVSGQFKIRDDSSILVGGAFAEAYFSEDVGSKSELYSRAITLNKKSKVHSASLQKDMSQIEALDQALRLFYHLDLCRLQASPYMFISELKTALNIAEEKITHKKHFECVVYYFLKTKITSLFVEEKYEELSVELEKIKSFDFFQCKEFQKFVTNAITAMRKDYDAKLLFITSTKETKDLWVRVLLRYMHHSAELDYMKSFNQINKELSKIKDMKTLLDKFKIIILDGAVRSFWKKTGNKLNSNPEDVGRSHLIVFLRALNKFEPTRESEVNFYNMDIFVIDKLNIDKAYIIETKVCKDQTTFDEGITQITKKYVKYKKGLHKKLEAFYVVFDARKKIPSIPPEIDTAEGKINIIHIPINRTV